MSDHDKLIAAVRDEVKNTVNGQIKKLDDKLVDYINEDMAWKERAEPMIKAYENSSGFVTTGKALLRSVILIAAALAAVTGVIKLFK